MKNKSISRCMLFFLLAVFFVSSCTEDEVRPTFPLSADIFYSVDDKQVAFTALTHSATNWLWNFGDGNSSTEQNPVYSYENGGYYLATLTATDTKGNTVVAEVNLAIALTPYVLLTGGPTATNGKTWKLTANHPVEDKFANADINFTYAVEGLEELPTGAFDLYLGIGEIYDDEFTFHFDGGYGHDVKDDGGTFAGLLYASVLMEMGGTTITKTTGELIAGADIFAIATYTPEASATFVYNESEDFTIPALPYFASGVDPVYGYPILTYPGVMTIDFPNSTEFIGVMDFQRKVIVQEITDNSMRLAMFMTLDPAAVISWDPLIPLSTTALVLTFEVVK